MKTAKPGRNLKRVIMKEVTLRLQTGWRQIMNKSYETCQQNQADFMEEAEKNHSDAPRSAVNENSSVHVKHITLANILHK